MVESAAIDLGCWNHWHSKEIPLRIGVSSCLLGENVRFDGGHARDRFVVETLGQWFEFIPVCPEMEIGMGTPRPTVRLVDEGQGLRMVAPSTGEDFTQRMQAYSASRIGELAKQDLDGYVLKKSSPSCGLERIRVYQKGMPMRRDERGLFAAELLRRWPGLPVEEEGRLNDPHLRENFIERVFCRNRWRVLVSRGLTRRRLVEFHTAHKLLIRAHNEAAYQRLGRLVGSIGKTGNRELFEAYETELQAALCTRATNKRHANVLQHALGYMKTELSALEKREILSAIEDYRRGLLPLVVPLTLLRYDIRRHQIDYLAAQLYFDPHPKELMLRNHA
ncbi:MAG: YbgA family protein [Planctomycetota bacterium]